MRVTKSYLNKYVKITWLDPQTHLRITLKEFLKRPLAKFESIGVVRYISKDVVILSTEHEVINEDCEIEEDLTAIPPSLIISVEKMK